MPVVDPDSHLLGLVSEEDLLASSPKCGGYRAGFTLQEQPRAVNVGREPAVPPLSILASLEVPLTQMRKATAQRLTESAAAPHFYLTVLVAVDALFHFRSDASDRLADQDVKVSVTYLPVRVCASTLTHHPRVNSSRTGWALEDPTRIVI